MSFDPRFLVFEFTYNLILRESQVFLSIEWVAFVWSPWSWYGDVFTKWQALALLYDNWVKVSLILIENSFPNHNGLDEEIHASYLDLACDTGIVGARHYAQSAEQRELLPPDDHGCRQDHRGGSFAVPHAGRWKAVGYAGALHVRKVKSERTASRECYLCDMRISYVFSGLKVAQRVETSV